MTTETLYCSRCYCIASSFNLYWTFLSRYRKCASDEILVCILVRLVRKKVVKTRRLESQRKLFLPSKIIHGGGTFVMPVIQDWAKNVL